VKDFRKQKPWQAAHHLVLSVYAALKRVTREEYQFLTSEVRRTATAIATEIVDGCVRPGDDEYAQGLKNALDQGTRLEYYLVLVRDLGCLDQPSSLALMNELQEVKTQLSTQVRKHVSERPMRRGKFPF
jgi:four helix bundle protein